MNPLLAHLRKHRGPSIVLLVAFTLTIAAGLYGINAPFVFGHLGYHGGEYSTRARHTLHNGVFLPNNMPGYHYPGDAFLYLHHPVLTHQLVTLAFSILGEHEFAVRIAALFATLAMTGAFAALLFRYAGPWLAALGTFVFALVPIHLWYAHHIDPGFPSIACTLLFFYWYFEFIDRPRPRSAPLALFFLALACGFDWAPYLVAVPTGLHVLYTAFKKRGRYITFIPLFGLALLLPLALHFWAVYKTGHIPEMMAQYTVRTAKLDPAAYFRRIWVYAQAYYGIPLSLITAAWLPMAGIRLLRGTSKRPDLPAFSYLCAFVFYTLWFKDAVMTHGYRMMYAAVPAAWAATDLAHTLASALSSFFPKRRLPVAFGLVALIPIALLLPVSWQGLLESRAHQGIPDWKTFDPFIERSAFAREVQRHTQPGDHLYIHRLFPMDRMELAFYLNRDQTRGFLLSGAASLSQEQRAHALLLFPLRGLSSQEAAALRALKQRYPYTQIGGFAWIDTRIEVPDTKIFTPQPQAQAGRSLWDIYWNGPYPWPALVKQP